MLWFCDLESQSVKIGHPTGILNATDLEKSLEIYESLVKEKISEDEEKLEQTYIFPEI